MISQYTQAQVDAPKPLNESLNLTRNWAISWPVALFAAWTLAWFVELRLRDAFAWDTNADTVYWIAMKVALWVVPVIVVLRRGRIAVLAFVQLTGPRRGIGIGLLAGLGLLAFSFAMDAVLGGRRSWSSVATAFAVWNSVS